jgi:carbamoyl-phosphate synthase large subunit
MHLLSLATGLPGCPRGWLRTFDFFVWTMESQGMPERSELETVLMSGAGRIVIGQPTPADRAAAATVMLERRAQGRERTVGGTPINLFIRQPFTESDEQQQRLIGDILCLIDGANGSPYRFNYLTGIEAESAVTFKKSFERDHRLPFTPQNFRNHRLRLLDQADAFINIRVGMSESSAFELSYHIFKGRCTPILFLVWKHAPIKTTLIRELDDLCDVTYLEFEHVDELREGIHRFFNTKALGSRRHPPAGRGRSATLGVVPSQA